MSDDLQTQVKGKVLALQDLPTLPSVLDEVTELVKSPDSTTEQVAELISRDQVLSAKVLKMVNSPIYGFPGRISSIQHALVLLGFNVMRGIIISTSVFDIMQSNMKGLWEHSIGCAMASSVIARQLGHEDPEEFAVAGLLHDLGKVVTALQLPELSEQIATVVKTDNLTYIEAEKKLLGFGHERINDWLAGHWGLPKQIREAMSYHHRPTSVNVRHEEIVAVVHVADFVVRLFNHGFSGDDQTAYLHPDAMRRLGLKMSTLQIIITDFREQLFEISNLTF
ncbi:MAG: HDOD domain-containing protein [Desulfovibrio sp.]